MLRVWESGPLCLYSDFILINVKNCINLKRFLLKKKKIVWLRKEISFNVNVKNGSEHFELFKKFGSEHFELSEPYQAKKSSKCAMLPERCTMFDFHIFCAIEEKKLVTKKIQKNTGTGNCNKNFFFLIMDFLKSNFLAVV